MKILQVGPHFLTNQEVYAIVKQEIPDLRRRRERLDQLLTSRDNREGLARQLEADTKLLTWLENCYPAVGTKRAAVDEFLAGIADLELADDEVLQLINLAPVETMYLYSLCEDCENRFSEEDLQRICDLVKKHLLPSLPNVEDSGAGTAEVQEGGGAGDAEPPSKKQKV
mmetsp:Transcript_76965/g.156673  ORF Transcript_76965/g.156673 Transcript_76965/m.156673 type:complete len:169 (+) Transcript_76965:57-563(+)